MTDSYRRPRGSGTIEEKDGRYRGIKVIKGTKIATPLLPTRDKAERALRRLSIDTSSSASFGKAFDLFEAASNHSHSTRLEYRRLVESHLKSVMSVSIDTLDVSDFGKIIKRMKAEGLSRQTINQVRVCIRGAYVQAIAKGWTEINVGLLLRVPTTKPVDKTKFLMPDEVNNLTAYLHSAGEEKEPHRSSWLIGYRYGLRPSERRGLCWENIFIDGDRAFIEIRTQIIDERQVGTVFTDTVKTPQSQRRIYLDSQAWQWLREHRAAEAERTYAEWTDAYGHSPDLVWRQPSGRPLTTTYEQNHWRRVQRAAGVVNPVSPYAMRHTAATIMLAPEDVDEGTLGIDPVTASRILGHTDLQLITRVYSKALTRTQGAAADAFDRISAQRQVSLDF